tara:strand:+ start:270 stop:545 length:276 start_codon:yes stop_codon:yes gene_type:complete
MAEQIKFTDEELNEIQSIQDNYNDISIQFGQIEVQKILINQQLETLEKSHEGLNSDYKKAQQIEKELSEKLNKKYGTGTLDIKTGIFTPQQ